MDKKWFVWATAVLISLLLFTACSPSESQTSDVVLPTFAPEIVPEDEEAVPATSAPEEIMQDTAVPLTPTEARMLNIPDLGIAPELVNETWLNTDAPVTIASQRGKVILLEFWTFG